MALFNKKEGKKEKGISFAPSSFKKTNSFAKKTTTFVERFKKLSKRDLAFVLMGVVALITAPVAEYFLSTPPKDNLLTPGFGSREGSLETSSLYEPGINALSEGMPSAVEDIVTPLSGRDPLSLILGAKKPEPQPIVPPPSSYRDTLKDVARESFSRAAKSAGAPTPIPKMMGSLRSLGSFMGSGGTRTTFRLPKGDILKKAKSASSKAAKRSMVGPVAPAGYKGVANTPNSASKGAYEQLRSMAGKAAGHFTDQSAVGAVDAAAKESANVSGSGGMGYGKKGEGFKKPSNSSLRNSHSSSGETLAQRLERMKQEAAFENWKFYHYELKKQLVQSLMDNIVKKGLIEPFGEMVKATTMKALGMGGSAPPPYACYRDANPNPSPSESCMHRVPKLIVSKEEAESLERNGACPCGIGPYYGDSSGGGGSSPDGSGDSGDEGEGNTPGIVVDENSRKYLSEIDNYLETAKRIAKQEALPLSNDINPKNVKKYGEKLNTVVSNLKEAEAASANLVKTYINPLFQQHVDMVSDWKSEGAGIHQEASLTETKIQRRYIPRVEGAAPHLLPKDRIEEFTAFVQDCAKNDKDETLCAEEAVEKFGSPEASVLTLANLKVKRSLNCISSARRAGRDIIIIADKIEFISLDAPKQANRDMEMLAQAELDSFQPRIDAAIKKYKTEPTEANKAELQNVLAELWKAEESPAASSNPHSFMLKGRWLAALEGVTVVKHMQDVTGIKNGENFDARISEDRKKETEWWKENNPFDANNMNGEINLGEELSLVGLMERGYNVYKGIEEYKGRIKAAKDILKLAEPHAQAAVDLICGEKGVLKDHSYCTGESDTPGGSQPPDNNEPSAEDDTSQDDENPPADNAPAEGNLKQDIRDRFAANKGELASAGRRSIEAGQEAGKYGCISEGCHHARKEARRHLTKMEEINQKIIGLLSKKDATKEDLAKLQAEFESARKDFYGEESPRVDVPTCVNNRQDRGLNFVEACANIPNLARRQTIVYNNTQYFITNIAVDVDQRSILGPNVFVLTLNNGNKYAAKPKGKGWQLIKKLN